MIDKQQRAIFDLTTANMSTKGHKYEFRSNGSLCSIAIAQVTNEIFMFYRLTLLGSPLKYLETQVVALKGMGATMLVIGFNLKLIEISSDLKTPSWNNLNKLSYLLDFHQLNQSRSRASSSSNFMDIPTFLEKSTNNSPPIISEDKSIHILA